MGAGVLRAQYKAFSFPQLRAPLLEHCPSHAQVPPLSLGVTLWDLTLGNWGKKMLPFWLLLLLYL